MSDGQEEPAVEISGARLRALFVYLKQREDELDQENFSTLRAIERKLFEYMSIEEVEQLTVEQPPYRGNR